MYWGNDAKKGYAGTAVLSKMEPLNVTYGMDTTTAPQAESAGREFGSYHRVELV